MRHTVIIRSAQARDQIRAASRARYEARAALKEKLGHAEYVRTRHLTAPILDQAVADALVYGQAGVAAAAAADEALTRAMRVAFHSGKVSCDTATLESCPEHERDYALAITHQA